MVCYMYVHWITFYHKVNCSRNEKKKKKKKLKLLIVQVFDWLNRHLVYYLYMNECGCESQQLI